MSIEYYVIGLFIDQFGADWVAKFLEWRRMMEKKWGPAESNSAFHQRFLKKKFLVGKQVIRSVQRPEDQKKTRMGGCSSTGSQCEWLNRITWEVANTCYAKDPDCTCFSKETL